MSTTSNKPEKKPLNDYAKYSGIAFKMMFICLAGVFGGIKLDEYFRTSTPYFTIFLSIAAVALSIYAVVIDLLKK
jgi:ATP synthase protein I